MAPNADESADGYRHRRERHLEHAAGDEGRHPRGRARHALPAGDEELSPRRCCPSSTSRRSSTSSRRRCTAGLTDILVITGRGKRAIEDHFDRNFELEHYLENAGKHELLEEVRRVRSRRHPLHPPARSARPRARGVGARASTSATSRSRCCSATTSWSTTARLLRSMLDVHEREHASVLALLEVTPEEISSYGCVEPDIGRRITRSGAVGRREADARRGAVEPRGDRALRVHARDLRRARPHRARRGGELQLTDAIALLLDERAGVRPRVLGGPLRHRPEARLSCAPTSSSRSTAPTSGPPFAQFLRRAGPQAGGSCDPARKQVQRPILDASARWNRARSRRATRSASCSRPTSRRAGLVPPFANTAMDGYAVRARSTLGASDDSPVRLQVVGELPAGHAPTIPVGAGEAIRIMTGAPMPDGADAIVMVERTERDGDDGVRVFAEARDWATTCAPPAATSARARSCSARHRASGPRTSACSRASTCRGCMCIRGRGSACCRPATSSSSPARSRRARSATRNRPMLLALLERGRLRRRRRRHRARRRGRDGGGASSDARPRCDALLTSGAVSVGDYDFVKVVLERIAAKTLTRRPRRWSQVAIKPAKPLAFALCARPARVRAAGQPGVVARELRAVRPSRAPGDAGGSTRLLPARGDRARRGTRCPAAPTASCTSTGSS